MAITASPWLSLPEQEGQSRQARRRDRKVNDIMAFTAQAVAERGYHMTSLDDIAERLDLSKASIYHYFDGKEALVRATLESCADFTRQRMAAVIEEGGSATTLLSSLIREHISMTSVENAEMSRLFLQPIDWPPAIADTVHAHNRHHVALFRDVIQQGVGTGEFATADVRMSNMAIQGAMSVAPAWYGKALRGRGGNAVLEVIVQKLMLLVEPVTLRPAQAH